MKPHKFRWFCDVGVKYRGAINGESVECPRCGGPGTRAYLYGILTDAQMDLISQKGYALPGVEFHLPSGVQRVPAFYCQNCGEDWGFLKRCIAKKNKHYYKKAGLPDNYYQKQWRKIFSRNNT